MKMRSLILVMSTMALLLASCGGQPSPAAPQQGDIPQQQPPTPSNEQNQPPQNQNPQTSATLSESQEAAQVAQWVKDLPVVGVDENHFSVIGTISMHMLHNNVRDTIMQQGTAAFYADPALVAQAETDFQNRMNSVLPAMQDGGLLYLRDVQNFPWGLLEPQQGEYHFELSDAIVNEVHAQGLEYVGVVMPFAGWDLAANGAADEICTHFFQEDYPYLAYEGAMGRYADLDAFVTFLGKLVERYDGDGMDDAPGLQRGVKYWQLHNEPEGENCGQFRNDPEAFVEFMQRGYEAVHAACEDCQVMNGGAAIPLWKNAPGSEFWSQYVQAGGAPYQDVIAIHYNEGKHDANGGTVEDFETQIQAMYALGADKPMWVTEFGVLVGENDTQGRFTRLPEKDAAAWYLRFYTAGLANGVDRFFSDNISFHDTQKNQILLPFYVNKLLEAKLNGFTEAEKIADGQYRFTVNGSPVYILWNGIPSELSGSVTATDMYGNTQTVDAATLQPSEGSPLIVEIP
ncbi:MAG TPA: glycosyl hydrolase [Anaerolineales bacterium]|nr:glycosyl hydrolase [Anaerolineales bacterium]